MGIQEIIAIALVGAAVFFAVKKTIHQFKYGEGGKKCAECELNKAINEKNL